MTVWRRLLSSHDGFPSSSDSREGITVIDNRLIIKENDSYDGNDSTSPFFSYFDMACLGRPRSGHVHTDLAKCRCNSANSPTKAFGVHVPARAQANDINGLPGHTLLSWGMLVTDR